MKKTITSEIIFNFTFAVGLACSLLANTVLADPIIVNLNARVNGNTNPVTVLLSDGNWLVTPIDTSMGGAYTAWNAWGTTNGCDPQGENCNVGWLNEYRVSAPSIGITTIGTSIERYQTADLAFSNAGSYAFTLNSQESVGFRFGDAILYDNQGGMSFLVEKISDLGSGICADNLWNIKWFQCDYGHDNSFQLNRDGTPVCGSENCGGPFCWAPTITQQYGTFPDISWSTDSSGGLFLTHNLDYQVYGDTYLYVESPNTLNVSTVSDVGRVWLNNSEITISDSSITLNLIAGWNHVEWTSYNQNQGTTFSLDFAFADNVDWMRSYPPNDSDIDCDGKVDLIDFSYISSYWLKNNPPIDLAPAPIGDDFFDILDLAVFVQHWLEGTTP